MKIIPELYEKVTTGLGPWDRIGSLPDVTSCKVTEERNGEFYLEMTYPADGRRADQIRVGRIISAAPRPSSYGVKDPFRIATIEKHLDGTMDITAYHASYDLSNVIVMPFTASNLSDALDGLVNNSVPETDFDFSTDMSSNKSFTVTQPTPLRDLLFGTEGSIVDTYGGEFKFYLWSVTLMASRGTVKNVQIAYGKNLRAFTETDENGPYDAIVPYAVFNDTTYYLTDTNVCATAPVVESSTSYGYPRTIAVDFSDQFTDTAPTQAQLLSAAQSYISGHSTSSTANYATGFLDLSKLIGKNERIDLCDTILLSVKPYNVYNMRLKVICTVYDCLLDEYESVQVGDKKITLADTLAELMR